MAERSTELFRIAVRVKPGASRTRVGGRYGDGALVVAVTAKAVDGQATEAVLRAVADALDVPRRSVCLILGATSRDKVLGVALEGAAGGAVEAGGERSAEDLAEGLKLRVAHLLG